MKTVLVKIGIILGVFIVLAGLWVTNSFIYPFQTVHPNYADVERAFARLQFPADWQEISSSENRGLHGRDCDPLNSSGCFHKSKKYKIPKSTTQEDIKKILDSAGCPGIVSEDITIRGDEEPSYRFSCGIGEGISIAADLIGPEQTTYVSVRTY